MNDYYPPHWDIVEDEIDQERERKIKELGMTKVEYWEHLLNQEIENHKRYDKLSKCEEAYRRGYLQGFVAGRDPSVDFDEVRNWRYSKETVAPPGSGLAGMHLDGLTENDEHRFFINRLKKDNWSE